MVSGDGAAHPLGTSALLFGRVLRADPVEIVMAADMLHK